MDQSPRVATLCPFCKSADSTFWAEELGWTVVRCECRILYVNPRPADHLVDAAVRLGFHEAEGLDVRSRRQPARVDRYRHILGRMFSDVWRGDPITWLDVGAGYGEVVEAVTGLAPEGSIVRGIEPMAHKASDAAARGLDVENGYLTADHGPVDCVSLVDVFSHILDFGEMLDTVRAVLRPGGEVFIETGNLADLERRHEYPGELGVPDHLVFAGLTHMRSFLHRAGFEIVTMRQERCDGVAASLKTVAKRVMGRPVRIGLPNASRYRSLQIRAKLH